MSYHDIIIVPRYQVQCQHCKFHDVYESAGEAEVEAKRHIDFLADDDGRPHDHHTVVIHPFTAVGRHP